MNGNQPLKKMIVGALLAGGVALTGLGLTAGTASAAPSDPGPTIDYSDFGVPIVECIQCRRAVPGDGSVKSTRQPWTQVGRRLGARCGPLRRPLSGTGIRVRPATGSLVAGRTSFCWTHTVPRAAQAVAVTVNGPLPKRSRATDSSCARPSASSRLTYSPAGPMPYVYGTHHSSNVGCTTSTAMESSSTSRSPAASNISRQVPAMRPGQ